MLWEESHRIDRTCNARQTMATTAATTTTSMGTCNLRYIMRGNTSAHQNCL